MTHKEVSKRCYHFWEKWKLRHILSSPDLQNWSLNIRGNFGSYKKDHFLVGWLVGWLFGWLVRVLNPLQGIQSAYSKPHRRGINDTL